MIEFRLKKGREKSIQHGHPWVFTGAIDSASGKAEKGDLVRLVSSSGEAIATGQFSPSGSIFIRVMETDPAVQVDQDWIRQRVARAVSLRHQLFRGGMETHGTRTTAYRLIFSESDFLPGVIVDQFGDLLVFQATTWWAEKNRETIARILLEETGCVTVFERGDGDGRKQDHLPLRSGILAGEDRLQSFSFYENGFRYEMEPGQGQKTGFYTDQRENREILEQLADQKRVLDTFSYTGGFTLSLLRGGAREVTVVDSSSEALGELERNLERNGFGQGRVHKTEGDAFEILRQMRDRGEKFDMIVLDPPKLAPSKKVLDKALRAYKDLNLLGMKLLEPGGLLATFSCSGSVGLEDFRMALGWASVDAGREARILRSFQQGSDHPIRLSFPESFYLKGFLLTVE